MDSAVYLAAGVAGVSCIAATTATLYRCIRPRFPVRVNCWFCNKNTDVPFGNRNCWDCPHCDQYNGFAQDGDYNKPIPAQYVEDFNYPITPERNTDFNSSSDVLCQRCQSNQLLKVKQLANFVPQNEATFDIEVDLYKQHLDEIYRLCRWCEQSVYEVLDKQDRMLRKKVQKHADSRSDKNNTNSFIEENELSKNEKSEQTPVRKLQSSSLLYGALTTLIAVMLLLIASDKLLVHNSFHMKSRWSVLNNIVQGVRVLSRVRLLLAGCGLLCSSLLVFTNINSRLRAPSVCVSMAMLSSVIILSQPSWLPHHDNLVLQIVVSVVTLLLSVSLIKQVVKRRDKYSIRITKYQPNKSMNNSGLAAGQSENDSPVPSLADDSDKVSVKSQEEEDCFSDFETMSIGSPKSPKKYRKKKKDIFSSYEPRQKAQPSSTTSPFLRAQPAHKPHQSSPILRPATFQLKPMSTGKSKFIDLKLHSPNRGFNGMPSTSMGFSNNNHLFNNSFNSGSGGLLGPVLSKGAFPAKNPWAGSCPGSSANSVASEDRGSLFNEVRVPKPPAEVDDDDDDAPTHQSGSSSAGSSICPADTTTDHPSMNHLRITTATETNKKGLSWILRARSIFMLSVLFNLSLLLYCFVDMDLVRAALLKTVIFCEHLVFGLKSQLNISSEAENKIL